MSNKEPNAPINPFNNQPPMQGCIGELQLITSMRITEDATPSGMRAKVSELGRNEARNSLLLSTLMTLRPEDGCHGCVAHTLKQQPSTCTLMPTILQTVDFGVGRIPEDVYVSELSTVASRAAAQFEKTDQEI